MLRMSHTDTEGYTVAWDCISLERIKSSYSNLVSTEMHLLHLSGWLVLTVLSVFLNDSLIHTLSSFSPFSPSHISRASPHYSGQSFSFFMSRLTLTDRRHTHTHKHTCCLAAAQLVTTTCHSRWYDSRVKRPTQDHRQQFSNEWLLNSKMCCNGTGSQFSNTVLTGQLKVLHVGLHQPVTNEWIPAIQQVSKTGVLCKGKYISPIWIPSCVRETSPRKAFAQQLWSQHANSVTYTHNQNKVKGIYTIFTELAHQQSKKNTQRGRRHKSPERALGLTFMSKRKRTLP